MPIFTPPSGFFDDPAFKTVILVVVAFGCIYWMRALHLARQGASYFLESIARASIAFVLALILLDAGLGQTNMQGEREQRFVIAGVVAALYLIVRQDKGRSRHIPKSVRKAVIARDLKGSRFNPNKHHIDHVWPFSLGGSHTSDNLRVIDKKENLKKGSKRPRFRDMW